MRIFIRAIAYIIFVSVLNYGAIRYLQSLNFDNIRTDTFSTALITISPIIGLVLANLVFLAHLIWILQGKFDK